MGLITRSRESTRCPAKTHTLNAKMPSEKEEVQTTTESAETEETPTIKAKTVDDVKRICEEAEKAKETEDTPAEKEAEDKTESAEETKEENGSSQEKEENTNQNASEAEKQSTDAEAQDVSESEKRSLDAEEADSEEASPTKKTKTEETT